MFKKREAGISLFPSLIFFLLFLLLLLLLEHLGIDSHILDVKVRMEAAKLSFTKVEALDKIFGSHKFNSILEVIRGLELCNI